MWVPLPVLWLDFFSWSWIVWEMWETTWKFQSLLHPLLGNPRTTQGGCLFQFLNWWVRSGCVASSQDPYEAEEVLHRLNTDERISQKHFCSSSRSSRCREPSNPRWHTFLFPFSSLCTKQLCQLLLARNELLVLRLFCQKRSRTVENVCREYLYRSNRKFPHLSSFFAFFVNQHFSVVIVFILADSFPSQAIPTPLSESRLPPIANVTPWSRFFWYSQNLPPRPSLIQESLGGEGGGGVQMPVVS